MTRQEVIKQGVAEQLAQHMNIVDPTGSIKFTHKESGAIIFGDTEIEKWDDRAKVTGYRK